MEERYCKCENSNIVNVKIVEDQIIVLEFVVGQDTYNIISARTFQFGLV